MRAQRYYGLRDIRLDEIPEPECRPGCVKMQPSYVGICGSDIHLYYDEAVAPRPDYVHPIAREPLPFVFGHEFGGVVTEVGEGVTRAAPGDLVAVRPSLYDGTCGSCAEGASNVCEGGWGWLGIHASGGLTGAAVVDEKAVFRMPRGVGPEVAALVEPLAVGWHAARLAAAALAATRGEGGGGGGGAVGGGGGGGGGLKADSTVLVVGGGPIGCAVFLALAAQGLGRIVVSEVSAARRELLRRLGAELVFSPEDTDIPDRVREASGGRGAEAAFDCAGVGATLETALAALRPRGILVNVALRAAPVSLSLNDYLHKEVTLVSSNAYTEKDWEEVIGALGNKSLKPEAMVTRKIALADLVEEGIKMLAQPGQKDCKVLVDVQG